MPLPITVAILAGGQSSRMGRDKAFIEIAGQPLIERILGRVGSLGGETILIANQPEDYRHLGLPLYPDVLPGKSNLGGLYTALTNARHEHVLALACDMPFLNRDLLAYLLSLRDGYDVVAPLNRTGYPQSMHAVYGKGCLQPIRRRLEADQLKVIGFYDDVRVREVGDDEIDRFDPERLSFFNVNTPGDLAEARRLADRLG